MCRYLLSPHRCGRGPCTAQSCNLVSPFVDVGIEQFTAAKTFDAVFGETASPLWGGGLQVALWRGRVYAELGASRLLKKNGELVGERAFVSGGTPYRLGIPLRSTIKSFELVGGYRFNVSRPDSIRWVPDRQLFTTPSSRILPTPPRTYDVSIAAYIRWRGGGAVTDGSVSPATRATPMCRNSRQRRVSQQFAEDTATRTRPREGSGRLAARLKLVAG